MSEPVSTPGHIRNLSSTATAVSNGQIGITDILITNTSGSTVFVQFFDLAVASIVVGSSRPLVSIPVANNAIQVIAFNFPWRFITQAVAAATSTAEGSGAVAAGVFLQCLVN